MVDFITITSGLRFSVHNHCLDRAAFGGAALAMLSNAMCCPDMTTRETWLGFCKRGALERLDRGDVRGAVASILSDMDKHPKTRMRQLGLQVAISRDAKQVRDFIEGFK